jgi:hypothetical protein
VKTEGHRGQSRAGYDQPPSQIVTSNIWSLELPKTIEADLDAPPPSWPPKSRTATRHLAKVIIDLLNQAVFQPGLGCRSLSCLWAKPRINSAASCRNGRSSHDRAAAASSAFWPNRRIAARRQVDNVFVGQVLLSAVFGGVVIAKAPDHHHAARQVQSPLHQPRSRDNGGRPCGNNPNFEELSR